MIIQHSQFKNAVAHLSEQLRREDPNTQFYLESAILRPQNWELKLDIPILEDETSEPASPYSIGFHEIDREEISLENTFIEVGKVDKAVELADDFVKNMEDISSATLHRLRNYLPFWEITYVGQATSGEGILIIVELNVEENRVVSSGTKPFGNSS